MSNSGRMSRRSFVSTLGAGCALVPLADSPNAGASTCDAQVDPTRSPLEPLPEPIAECWKASWIWLHQAEWSVNCYVLTRKVFTLDSSPKTATLRISAYSDYVLYLNGRLLGRGPEWNDADLQSYDVYDIRAALHQGSNIIAIVAHNYGIGTHWSPRGRGALIAQIDVDDGALTVASDSTWKMRRGEAWISTSPRMFWSAGFLETFDFNRWDPAWIEARYDDSGWDVPQIIGRPPVKPWSNLSRRQIPLLDVIPVSSTAIETGRLALRPLHAVRFHNILPAGRTGIVYAATSMLASEPRDIALRVECDDAFRLFVNGEQVAYQGYSEEFSRTRLWRGKDEYDQVHFGMGEVQYGTGNEAIVYGQRRAAHVRLQTGANHILVVVDHGTAGWGLLLDVADPSTDMPVNLAFGAGAGREGKWSLFGPFDSTGFNDSLDHVESRVEALKSSESTAYYPFDYTHPTDYATLMAGERRRGRPAVTPNDVVLNEGDYAIFDLGNIYAGYPRIEVESRSPGAILDVGYSQILTPDRRVLLASYGTIRYVDRLLLRQGTQEWQAIERRTGRYLHVSCRAGRRVKLRSASFDSTRYPTHVVGSFQSSDRLLNDIWKTSVYTTQLVMQQGYQDCLKREQGTLNTSSFNYASKAAAYSFGDYALARKTLRQAIRTQDRSGWFDSHGSSSPNSDEPSLCLWWAIWLADYYLVSGDTAFVQEVFDALEDNIRYWNKGINRFGLIEGRNRPTIARGETVYMDDGTNNGRYKGNFDGELIGLNIVYFAALRSAGFLASELGRKEASASYERRANRVRKSVDARFWDAQRQLYRDWRLDDELAPTHNAIFQIAMLHFGLVADERAARLVSYLTDEVGPPTEQKADYPLSTFGFYHYFLEVLYRNGASQAALDVTRRFYGRWLELGATTFGEIFKVSDYKGKSGLDTEYEVHAYGTSALAHFYTNILGIRPLLAGFRKVAIAPRPGDLSWAAGQMATPRGLVKVAWKVSDGRFELEVSLPDEMPFEVQKPAGFAHYQVQVNGVMVSV